MKSAFVSPVLVAACLALAVPGTASGEEATKLHKIVVTAEVPVAIPLSQPLRDRFGLGAMPSLSASVPVGQWTLLGLRLRGGFLSNGPAPANPAIKDPGTGGMAVLAAVARFRPLAKRFPDSRAQGPFVELGAGLGLTGSLARAVGEVAVGWNFHWRGVTFGPSLRYAHVIQPANSLDSSDAQIVLAGLEIVLHDAHDAQSSVPPATAQPEMTAPMTKVSDRDGDGIPDELDKCPDAPEDKDGFEDEDGCPDLDNDKDGIPDTADACPNEPETVNGFQDEDGCPDSAPIVVKENRIVLTELVLFDTNRARVNAEGRPALAAVLNLWKQHPEWDYLVVDGYADRRGPDGFNLWLSHLRAERAIKVLVEMGFPADKLRIRAFGHRQLRVAGDTDEADRQNRRVEFIIVKKGEAPSPENEAEATQPPAQTQPGAIEP
jgi:outer membrane protein OmpA-like peptidoglycan-associated protein